MTNPNAICISLDKESISKSQGMGGEKFTYIKNNTWKVRGLDNHSLQLPGMISMSPSPSNPTPIDTLNHEETSKIRNK